LAITQTRRLLPCRAEARRAADHLIGVLGIDAQADGHVDALVELGDLGLGDQLAGLSRRTACCGPPWRPNSGISSLACGIVSSSFCLRPLIEDFDSHRFGVPAIVRIAASTLVVFRSGIFMLGDLAQLLLADLADLDLVGLLGPRAWLFAVGSPMAFLIKTAAGGSWL
jgi:hypothetical protein